VKNELVLIGPDEAEFSVKHSMFCFPSIFPTRQHVLNQYFLVIGTGMDWVDGGLAHDKWDDGDRYCTRRIADMMRAGKSDAAIWKIVRARDIERFKEEAIKDLPELKKMLPELARDLEKIHKPDLPPKPEKFTSPYPICEYSALMTVPKDVRPDWWELWKEALKLAKTVPLYGADQRDGEHRADAKTKKLGNKRQLGWIKKAAQRARDLGLYKKFGGGMK